MGGKKGRRRTATPAALVAAAVLALAAPPWVDVEPRTGTAPAFETVAAQQDVSPTPPPPRLPRDFRGKGKWIVRDLDITVPFTWRARTATAR